MIPVMQTKCGEPDGNCFNACLASILETKLEDVPEFGRGPEWWDRVCDFVGTLGFFPLRVNWEKTPDDDSVLANDQLSVDIQIELAVFIVSGYGPRGILHSVVYQGNQLIHDPHPEGGGIICWPVL